MTRLLFAFILTTQLAVFAQTPSESFNKLVEDEWAWTLKEFPETATYTGFDGRHDQWTDNSGPAIQRRKQYARDVLDKLKDIDRAELGPADRVNYDLLRKDYELSVAGQRFKNDYLAINQMGGVQQDLAQTLSNMPTRTKEDFENIIGRIRNSGPRIDQEVTLLRSGLELGITPPIITLRDVPEQVMNQLPDNPQDSPMLTVFKTKPIGMGPKEWGTLKTQAIDAWQQSAVPSYRRMHTFLVNEYLPGARKSIAASDLPDGEAWYAHNIKVRTTTDMTPKEIHELGLIEVKRIRGEMDKIIKQTEFKGSFTEFCDYLRTDPKFYYTDAEELLRGYRDIAKRIDPELPKLFATLPRNPYGVIPVPSYAEKSQTTAYYMAGSPRAGRPGYFFANTYALNTRPKWEMEALTVHEAVPGHHLQISIAQELENVPEFRKWGGYTAFVEGWGLYSESLGEELGLYTDPYSKFGQLTYEIWRAVRLVVDTGMHSLGWTRQQAIDYFAQNSSKQLHDITVEIDRYIVWPGQALAYKLGELTFKRLRAKAEKELGDRFDIRRFHDACLENGALPLDVLEKRIEEWIKSH
jgi:uncharacterized protein (DUF885 family)